MAKTPIQFQRYSAWITQTDLVEGQAVTFGDSDLTVKAVSGPGDFVLGFAQGQKFTAGHDCEIFREAGECYALNDATAIAKGDLVRVNAAGKIEKALSNDLSVGYAMDNIAANKLGPIFFTRGQNSKFEKVTFTNAVNAGEAVKLATAAGQVTKAAAATDLVYGFAVKTVAANGEGYIYREGNVARAKATGTAITKGAVVTISAAGLIETGSTNTVGYALEAIAANGIGNIYFTRGA